MPKTKPNPWNLAGPLFIGMTLSGWLLTLGICQALNAPDWAVAFVLVPAWVLAVPAAAFSAVRITERVYAAHAPVFDWAALKRDVDMGVEALLGLLAGVMVLGFWLLLIAGVVALIVAMPISLAIIVAALFIAKALRHPPVR